MSSLHTNVRLEKEVHGGILLLHIVARRVAAGAMIVAAETDPPPAARTANVDRFKLVFLGDQSVGKTSIITKFMYDTFDNTYQATIGIDFLSKTLFLEDKTVRLQIWDTAGQERFRSLIPSYIRDCRIGIIVFDVTNRPSFNNVRKWLDDVRAERGPEISVVAVGNKVDLVETRTVTCDEATKLASELGILYVESSAKSGLNIKRIFRMAANSVAPGEQPLGGAASTQHQTVDLGGSDPATQLSASSALPQASPAPSRCRC